MIFRGLDAAAVLYGFGKRVQALRAVERILTKRSGSIRALLLKARILSDLGKGEAALRIVDSVLALRPRSVDALTTKAEVLFGVGRYGEAARLFRKLIRDRPSGSPNRAHLYWELSNTLLAQAKFPLARKYLRRALKEYPRDEWLRALESAARAAGPDRGC